MAARLLICTDLDRTLLPNGSQPESPGARDAFAALASRDEVMLAYVSGRHRVLVEAAMAEYQLPVPDFVIADVGTTIYAVGREQKWLHQQGWEAEIAVDWNGRSHADLAVLMEDLPALTLQEAEKQGRFKLSYYTSSDQPPQSLLATMRRRLEKAGVRASLIWSEDEQAGVGLLDLLPERATKFHAVDALIRRQGLTLEDTVFCGDSGNDLEVLASPVPAVLVANSQPQVQQMAQRLAEENGQQDCLYIARGGFMGMNGNYAAGMLEGIAHYHPEAVAWMGLEARSGAAV